MKGIKFRLADRRRGKTTALVEWAKQAPEGVTRVIVCVHSQEAKRLKAEHDVEAVGYMHLRQAGEHWLYRGRHVEFAVDDADRILARIIGTQPVMVAATGEAIPIEQQEASGV